jgi:hypothetical protein
VSDPNSFAVPWREVLLSNPIGFVNNMVFVQGNRRLVLATETGVFWVDVPTSKLGNYTFHQAKGVFVDAAVTDGPFYGLAIGPDNSIIVTSRTKDHHAGDFFYGTWEGSDLVLREANLGSDALVRLEITTTSVASSPQDPNIAYAVSASFHDQTILAFWTSTDGGRSWAGSIPSLPPPKNTPLGQLSGQQGDFWNNCIAVSPTDSQFVAIGWVKLFYSKNGGQTWTFVDGSKANHDDHHRIVFGESNRIYLATDGGVCSTDDDFQSFNTAYNRHLATLQFLSPSALRQFWGLITTSPSVYGLIAGGTQDNDNVYCITDPPPAPWQAIGDAIGAYGDGGVTLFISTGPMLASSAASQVTIWDWNVNQQKMALDTLLYQAGTIPIRTNGQNDFGGLVQARAEVVDFPQDTSNGTIFALGSTGDLLYGLYGTLQGGDLHWQLLTQVPVKSRGYITSLASYSGKTILIGTTANQIFVFDVSKQTIQPANGLPQPAKNPPDGAITRIVLMNELLTSRERAKV